MKMAQDRFKALTVSSLVIVLAATLFSLSYFQDSAEAYLFPRIIAFTMLLLSLVSGLKTLLARQPEAFGAIDIRRLLPAFAAILLAVAVLETVGMYTTTATLLLVLSLGYSSSNSLKTKLISSTLLTLLFMAFMYVLFSVLLNVQTPRGWFI